MNKRACWGKFLTGFTIILVLSALSFPASAAKGKECADITKEQIANTLKKMSAQPADIVGIKKSPLDGICEIEVKSKGSPGIFYTDVALNYFIFGTLFDARSVVNLTAQSVQKLQDQKRIDLAKIAVNENLAVGEKGAAKKVIIFSDPD